MTLKKEFEFVKEVFIVQSVKEAMDIALDHQKTKETDLDFCVRMANEGHNMRKTTVIYHEVYERLHSLQ